MAAAGGAEVGNAVAAARAVLRAAQAVCFDVDSTVCTEEGIDVLAAFAGVGEQVSALTRTAMNGNVRFEDALAQRLALIRPSAELLTRCLRAHPPQLSPGIAGLMEKLRARGATVWLISGGFRQMIAPAARQLGINDEHIIANVLRFADDGSFVDFDPSVPTARSGGKALALAQLRAQFGYAQLVMIGDGVTDMEARPPADAFIGYGGVVVREKVKAGADWFVTDFTELLRALDD